MLWRPKRKRDEPAGETPDAAPRRRGARTLTIAKHGLGLFVGVVAGLGLFDRVLMPLVVRQGKEVAVPNVTLMDTDVADSVLVAGSLGLLVVAERDDPEVLPGRILEQVPAPGMKVKGGRTVRVLVSSGVEGKRVPEIRGQPVSHARLMLTREGIRLGKVTHVASDEVPDHTVVAAHPGPGRPIAEDAEVDLLVSSGRPPSAYLMPDLRGRRASSVRGDLEAAGLRVTVRPWPGSPVDNDEIVEQTPPAGHRLSAGGTVELLTGRP